jgi:hypothetical protein
MSKPIYEIDITPPDDTIKKIAEATKHALGYLPENFRPHIAIKEPFAPKDDISLDSFCDILSEKISAIKTLKINLPKIKFFYHKYSPLQHKTIYLEVIKNKELADLHKTVIREVNKISTDVYGSHKRHEKDYVPHLSLEWEITKNFDELLAKFNSKNLKFIFEVEKIDLFEEVDPDKVMYKKVKSFYLQK